MSDLVQRLQAMLDSGRDDAVLRFGLGQALVSAGRTAEAVEHLRAAVRHDAGYSAAWKLLGRSLTEEGEHALAMEAFRGGIEAAEDHGDKQAALEMRVFLRRLKKVVEP
jgi:predicted Zn-dependent protease